MHLTLHCRSMDKMRVAEPAGQHSHGRCHVVGARDSLDLLTWRDPGFPLREPGFPLVIRNEDVFSHVTFFLHLEDVAVLMSTSRMLRQKCVQLPQWRKAEAQLSAMNGFDCCPHCEKLWRSEGHVKACYKNCGDRGYKWLQDKDPRLAPDYVETTPYVQFGRLYRFHAACTKNLLSFFGFGGDANNLDHTDSTFENSMDRWVPALNELFEPCPRRFHLLNDIVSMSMACSDLEVDGGPYWYRPIFQGSWEHPNTGNSFNNAFSDRMEDLYDLAIKHQVQFGSRKHLNVWARSLGCHAERDWNGLGKLGSRLLRKVSPMWRLKKTINKILDRCNEEFDGDFYGLKFFEGEYEEFWDALADKELQDEIARIRANETGLCEISFNEMGFISEQRMTDLAGALRINTTLTALTLRHNGLGVTGAEALAGVLRINTTLISLCIAEDQFGRDGAFHIASALSVNTTLEQLIICGNTLKNAGTRELAAALRLNTTLTHLAIHRNGVGADGAREIAAALRVNTSLVNLTLGGRWMSWRNHVGIWEPCALQDVVKQELREVWTRRGGEGRLTFREV